MKKISLITIGFILAFVINVNAQKLSVDALLGIHQSFRSLHNANGDVFFDDLIEDRNNREKPMINNVFGINLNYHPNRLIALKTGIRYNKIGYKNEFEQTVLWPSDHNGDGSADGSIERTWVQLYDVNRFFQIPLSFRMYPQISKLRWYTEFGVALNIYSNTKSKSDLEGESITNTSNLSDIDGISRTKLGVGFAIGIEQNIRENSHVFVQLGYNCLISTNTNQNIDEHLYNYGLEIGFRQYLKKNK